MFISLMEIIDILIMSAAVGYIFSGMLAQWRPQRDPLLEYAKGLSWENFKFAAMITAPAIILHEFGHKFMAIAFGMQATFQAAYLWLGIGVVLKLVNFPFLFFIPAYTAISGAGTPLQFSAIAFAGPAVNALLWGLSYLALKMKPKKKYVPLLILSGKINMFLFLFNLIPIPGFDGYQVFSGLIKAFF